MKKTIGRDLPNGDYVEIVATDHEGDAVGPYFAVTLSGWMPRGAHSGRVFSRRARDIDYGGTDHETILAVAPELEPLVKVHLARLDGTPMHARVNGWYFYSGDCSAYERQQVEAGRDYGYTENLKVSDHDRAARALHIDPKDLPEGLDLEGFGAFCDSLAPVWAEQASDARRVLVEMVDGDGVEDR